MLKTIAMLALGAAGSVAFASPASAQNAPQGGVLLIYGQDKCPTNTDGEEIVVCRRLDESERFRIPQDLRETEVKRENESWAVRQQTSLEVGGTGVGSCSTVGAGGQTGCFVKEATAAKAERRARKEAETNLPLP